MSEVYRHRGGDILALMEELGRMSELSAVDALHAFEASSYIYSRNYQDASSLINWVCTDPGNQDIAYQNSQRKRDALHLEVARQFQNYAASVDALLEHAHRLYDRHYKAGDRLPEYRARRRELKEDPVVCFTVRLRNILLHGETAKTLFHFRLGDEWSTISLGLPLEFLHAHKTWLKEPAAKAYLRGVQEFVDIAELLRDCNARVSGFAGWFVERQRDIHSEEIQRFDEKQREIFLLQIEDALDRWLANPDPVRCLAPGDEGVFHGVLDTSEFGVLRRVQEGSLARAELAIQMFEQRWVMPRALKNKLLRCYTDPNFFRHDLLRPSTADEWLEESEGTE